MRVLVIKATDRESGHETLFRFDQPPVRLGRSNLNELVLDHAFVSQCHGVIQFTSRDAFYLDLGSRNGSTVEGEAVPKQKRAPLRSGSQIGIGRLVLTVGFEEAAKSNEGGEQPAGPAVFAESGESRLEKGRAASSRPAVDETPLLPPGFVPPEAAPMPPPVPSLPAVVPAPAVPPGRLDPVLPKYEAGGTRVIPPSTDERPRRPGSSSDALREGLLARLRIAADRVPDNADRVLLVGALKTLELMVDRFVALRRAALGFGEELGVRPLPGATPLHRGETVEEVLAYVLDSLPYGLRKRHAELSRMFGDLLLHQVALLAALRDGVDEFLDRVDPAQPSFSERRLIGPSSLQRYAEFFADERESCWSTILGMAFARSYANAMQTSATSEPPALAADPGVVTSQARLVSLSEELPDAVFFLESEPFAIGRAEESNDAVVPHPSVSKKHARLVKDAGRWTIVDLESSNGVFVNGERYRTAPLCDGDVVQLGEIRFRFALG